MTNPEIRHQTAPMPEGCRWCGVPFRDHAQLWVKSKGWHGWEAPTSQQIKARIAVKYKKPQGDKDE